VQLELAGRSGIDDGRYPVRERGDADPTDVLIVQTEGAPSAWARPRRRRRTRPRTAHPAPEGGSVPVTRLTAVRTKPFATADEAREWLRAIGDDLARWEAEVGAAIAVANRALHARALAAADPASVQLGRSSALRVRLGYGTGDEVADGRWTEAIEVPPDRRRLRRVDALRPSERVAAILGARERPLTCETLILRSRADFDAGRDREAAVELRGAIEGMLAELGADAPAEQRPDLEALRERSANVSAIAGRALRSDPSDQERGELSEALAIGERVLRRRRILG